MQSLSRGIFSAYTVSLYFLYNSVLSKTGILVRLYFASVDLVLGISDFKDLVSMIFNVAGLSNESSNSCLVCPNCRNKRLQRLNAARTLDVKRLRVADPATDQKRRLV